MKILKFYGEWCAPCKMLSGMLKSIDLGVPVEEIDIDDNIELSMKNGVRGVPTMVLLNDDGVEIRRLTGLPTKAQLESLKA
jgi:thioredoxin 1